jgi:hypothetical protein
MQITLLQKPSVDDGSFQLSHVVLLRHAWFFNSDIRYMCSWLTISFSLIRYWPTSILHMPIISYTVCSGDSQSAPPIGQKFTKWHPAYTDHQHYVQLSSQVLIGQILSNQPIISCIFRWLTTSPSMVKYGIYKFSHIMITRSWFTLSK